MSFQELAKLEEKEIIPGFKARFVHSDNMTLSFWAVQAGAIMPEHAHPHEQMSSVVEGEFEMTLEGETQVLSSKTVAVIPANARHGGRAITNCRIMDVFYPVREDYK